MMSGTLNLNPITQGQMGYDGAMEGIPGNGRRSENLDMNPPLSGRRDCVENPLLHNWISRICIHDTLRILLIKPNSENLSMSVRTAPKDQTQLVSGHETKRCRTCSFLILRPWLSTRNTEIKLYSGGVCHTTASSNASRNNASKNRFQI
jgi:hypothetical protein